MDVGQGPEFLTVPQQRRESELTHNRCTWIWNPDFPWLHSQQIILLLPLLLLKNLQVITTWLISHSPCEMKVSKPQWKSTGTSSIVARAFGKLLPALNYSEKSSQAGGLRGLKTNPNVTSGKASPKCTWRSRSCDVQHVVTGGKRCVERARRQHWAGVKALVRVTGTS